MKYRNLKTGCIIDVPCEVSGEFWEPVAPAPAKTAAAKKVPAKKTTAKKVEVE